MRPNKLLLACLMACVVSPAIASAQAVRVGGQIKEPVLIKRVEPNYPLIAQNAKIRGTVILEITIDKDGRVTDARVLRAIPLLTDAAVEAVRQWRYSPTTLNGTPVDVLATVTVDFPTLPKMPPSPFERQAAPPPPPPPPHPPPPPQAGRRDVGAMLDMAKSLQERGLWDEAERVLEQALAEIRAKRVMSAVADAGGPLRIGGDIKEPRLLRRVEPKYPQEAMQAKLQGTVIIEATIDTAGRVVDARVLRAVAPILEEAALAAVRQWVYEPTMVNGVPVAVMMTVTVNFALR